MKLCIVQFCAYVLIAVLQFPLILMRRGSTWLIGWLDYQYWEIIRRDLRLP